MVNPAACVPLPVCLLWLFAAYVCVAALPGTALAVNPDTFNFTAVTGQIVNQVLQVLSNDQGDEMRLIPAPSGAAITPFPPRSTLQGTITRSGNVLIYQALFTGVAFTDRFRYRVEDVSGQSGSAVVTVNVGEFTHLLERLVRCVVALACYC